MSPRLIFVEGAARVGKWEESNIGLWVQFNSILFLLLFSYWWHWAVWPNLLVLRRNQESLFVLAQSPWRVLFLLLCYFIYVYMNFYEYIYMNVWVL